MTWEYVIIATNILAVDHGHQLDALGEEGWELVAVTNNKMYFKRPRPVPRLTSQEPMMGEFDG